MGRLLIFTAGTSLLENLQDPKKKLGQRALVEKFSFEGGTAWGKVLHRTQGIRADLVKYARCFPPLDLADATERSRVTAEMAGLYLLRAQQPASQDRLVLLCSDTGQGAFCALANGILLGQEVRYYPKRGYYRSSQEPNLTLAGLTEIELKDGIHPSLLTVRLPYVEVAVVQDLNASRPDTFEHQAIPALIKTMAQLHYNRPSAEEQTVLNYTGGFKAAIPTLAQAAAMAGNIALQCLYEDAGALISQPLMQIQLSATAEKRLLWAGAQSDKYSDPLQHYPTMAALKNGLPQKEWAFYEQVNLEKGVQLKLSSLGLAMRELLLAREYSAGTGR